MAEINNFSEITENFDTIKTLLNSIRAQGILNTSDVDKLLVGINSKLEKINTEEDIDLIKVFLSELKQNLDERHNVLISKFGAIESLFSNLLKNSSETLKSSEVKELFDIVATNLSVFSREVVSQKDILTDITLRIDAMRSDDSQKRDIIKSVSLLKNDIEHLNNGFDSIVLSLNENFKTLIKTLSGVDQSEAINRFGSSLENINNSSNTILSALQVLDKKSLQIEDFIKTLATQDDIQSTKKWLSDLVAKNHELSDSINILADKYYKIDNLAEKIDASVNIIAALKSTISESEDERAQIILNELSKLQESVKDVSTNNMFKEFQVSLESIINNLVENSSSLKNAFSIASGDIQKINDALKALDINIHFQDVNANISKSEQDIKEHINVSNEKLSQIIDVGITRTIDELSANADNFVSKLKDSHFTITKLCEKNFNEVVEDISGLKSVVSQIDENNVSANNAIFSNITDRLAIFENSLKTSLEKQEDYVANSASQLLEQVTNIKNLSGVIDYKLDASVIEVNNSKREFAELKSSVQDLLALDFVNVVKDLRVDLFAAKQDISNSFDNSSNELSEKLANDLFSKYELLISKLDSVEDEFKNVQGEALKSLKDNLDSISASIVDVLSYVSSQNTSTTDAIDIKLANITEIVKDNNLNYVENVRDIVEVIRTQVESDLTQIKGDTAKQISSLNSSISKNTEEIRTEIKYSYNKILEVQDNFSEIKDALNINNSTLSKNIGGIIASADNLRNDFEQKLTILKNSLLEKISDFQQEFTCENADKISEIKFASENLHTKSIQNAMDLKNELRGEISQIIGTLKLNVEELAEQLAGTSLKMEGSNREIIGFIKNDLADEITNAVTSLNTGISDFTSEIEAKTNNISTDFEKLGNRIEDLSKNTTTSLSSTLAQILDNFVSLKALLNSFNEISADNLKKSVDDITEDFAGLKDKLEAVDANIDEDLAKQVSIIENNFESLSNNIIDLFKHSDTAFAEKIDSGLIEISKVVASLNSSISDLSTEIDAKANNLSTDFEKLENRIEDLSKNTTSSLTSTLAQILDNFVSLKALLNSFNETSTDNLKKSVDDITEDFAKLKDKLETVDANIDEDLARQVSIIENNFESLSSNIIELFERSDATLAEKIDSGLIEISENMGRSVEAKLAEYKTNIETLFENISNKNNVQADFIKQNVLSLNSTLEETLAKQGAYSETKLQEISTSLKAILEENLELSTNDYNALKVTLSDFARSIEDLNKNLISAVKQQLDDITKFVDSGLDIQSQEVNNKFDEISSKVQRVSGILAELNNEVNSKVESIKNTVDTLKGDVSTSVSENSVLIINRLESILNDLSEKNEGIAASFISATSDVKNSLDSQLTDRIGQLNEFLETKTSELDELIENTAVAQQNSILREAKNVIEELEKAGNAAQTKISELQIGVSDSIHNEVSDLYERMQSLFEQHTTNIATQIGNTNTSYSETMQTNAAEFKAALVDIEHSIEEKVNSMLAASADMSAGELQSLEAFVDRIIKQVEASKQNTIACKDLIIELVQKEFDTISGDIEKETDVIVKDLVEQFKLFKDAQRDELSKLAVHIESSVEDYIYNYLNDLKSYLDVKTDTVVMNQKLDNIKQELNESADEIFSTINKFLETSVFSSAMSDLRFANEILVNSMAEKLNQQLSEFMSENVTEKISEKLNIFDKKFIDTVVDKYEEIKVISSKYNNSFETIQASSQELLSKFTETKDWINNNLTTLVEGINTSINDLNVSFADLKAQIMNKSFEEAFSASVNNQISGIEGLVKEQLGYLEDISDLCCNNLPELNEMSAIIKYSIQQSIADLIQKLDNKDLSLDIELDKLKSDIITQILNIFNQISFVAEQEEILDFIQEKHSELITILSHIVNTADNVTIVENKVDTLKDELAQINTKINSIISSEGDINYIYSLQDLESDIANLRLALNEIKKDNNSKELKDLVASTNDIYKLVETIKAEMPKFELEEFKKDFDNLSEDIVSISTRTNKLILASDESYKTLQDNLQDFKLVINDLDERTKNFAHEAGIDRIDNKLGSINAMIQSGAKTNQVFNQVFEYLAEWVDKAGEQINSINDKVETLDDIGQIKVMLEDLKAEAEDSSESTELIEALSNVFDKQAKKISSLEAKLDRVIVETTINNKNNKIDMSPFENTLNRFLVAIDDKMTSQQDRINSLESKLEEVMTLIDPKDTAQLTKKVGGMDRQIAKLNKSIEKIASHVVEK